MGFLLLHYVSAYFYLPPQKCASIFSWGWRVFIIMVVYACILIFVSALPEITLNYGFRHIAVSIDEYGVETRTYPLNGILYYLSGDTVGMGHPAVILLFIAMLPLLILLPLTKLLFRKFSWLRVIGFSYTIPLLVLIISSYFLLPLAPEYQAYFGSPQDKLIYSAYLGNEKRVAYYLKQPGVDVNKRGFMGNTAINMAVRAKKANVLHILFQYPVSNKMKKFAYVGALDSGDIPMVKEFLANGIDINTRWPHGANSLMWSYSREDLPMVKYLVAQGIDLRARDTTGRTVLNYAAEEWHPALLEYLLTKVPDQLNIPDNEGNTPLLASIQLYCPEFFFYPQNTGILIKHGANVNLQNKKGESPLYMAILFHYYDRASTLLENGADWKAVTHEGVSITEEVFKRCTPEFIDYYLKKTGYGINQKDKNGKTPLFYAIDGYNVEAVKYLISHGANAKIKDKKGKGLLSFDDECWDEKNRRELLRILGEAGATY
jgi:ankyrin repeat protein